MAAGLATRSCSSFFYNTAIDFRTRLDFRAPDAFGSARKPASPHPHVFRYTAIDFRTRLDFRAPDAFGSARKPASPHPHVFRYTAIDFRTRLDFRAPGAFGSARRRTFAVQSRISISLRSTYTA
jgi:hypothetical protein